MSKRNGSSDKATDKSSATTAIPPSPAPITTSVAWEKVVGRRLEELMHGLLEAMGANELIWRAGANDGVTAADGGRDLEATFASVTPDGSVDLVRWWVEVKGRKSTVKKEDVTNAVTQLTAHTEVDTFVFCTNSRYSNPTRDWVAEWQRAHPRTKIKLWDRDDLARLVRQHPLVAARTMPEALTVEDRTHLLLERFQTLGETPTTIDLAYLWAHKPNLGALERHTLIPLVTMLAYAESEEGLQERPWATLLPPDGMADIHTVVLALVDLPRLTLRELARPVDDQKLVATAAYLVISRMGVMSPEALHAVLENPHLLLLESEEYASDPAFVDSYYKYIVEPIWGRIHDELLDVCGSDCKRMIGGPGSAFPSPIVGERYWRRFGIGPAPDNRVLRIESTSATCLVGLPLTAERMCPLGQEPQKTLERVTELTEIVKYRKAQPKNHAHGTRP